MTSHADDVRYFDRNGPARFDFLDRIKPISRAFFFTDPTWRPSNSATISAVTFFLASALSRYSSLSVHSLGRSGFTFPFLFSSNRHPLKLITWAISRNRRMR